MIIREERRMSRTVIYDHILKYKAKLELVTPMHIGASYGDRNEVLIHPVDGIPFVQSSSLTGAIRGYYEKNFASKTAALFGSDEENSDSRIVVSDGRFEGDIKYEMRPRVKIDSETGTTGKSLVKGSNVVSGHKFDMECIAKGAVLVFDVYIKAKDYEDEAEIFEVFSALNGGGITLGGQKSNGFGEVKVVSLQVKKFDLTNDSDRKKWIDEEDSEKGYEEKKGALKETCSFAYRIRLKGMTESGILVKGYKKEAFGARGADAINIQDANGNYIIPGSSIKGSVRSQIERIVQYKGLSEKEGESVIKDIFGESESGGKTGNVRVYDSTIEVPTSKELPRTSRIHIDKLTGGVMNRGLFSEQRAYGNVEVCIDVLDKNNKDRSCGYVVLALRDLANNLFSLGGGYSIGNGMLKTECIEVLSGEHKAVLNMQSNVINDDTGLINRCIKATQEV